MNKPTEKQVLISIAGTHSVYGETPERVELKTFGILNPKTSGIDLSYEESELTGMEGTHTTFHIHDKEIALRRTGSVNMEMIFKEGERHNSLYDIGEGALLVQVQAQQVDINLSENGGFFELAYGIDVENEPLGVISYRVDVKTL